MSNAKIILRPFRQNDLDRLASLANNLKISSKLTDQFPHPYTVDHAKSFIERCTSAEPFNVLAIEVNSELAGAIGVHPQQDIFRSNAELGYWIAEPYWGQGVMSAAIKQMLAYTFNNFDVNRVFARPFSNNPASQRVLEKNGFKKEAHLKGTILKNNEVLDELIYAFRREMLE